MSYDSEGAAPFNMAVATLMRLDAILRQMKDINFLYPPRTPQKQEAHIGLVKQFYINAVPLLKDKAPKWKEEILNFSVVNKNSIKAGNQRNTEIYSPEIEKRLNEVMIEIQLVINKFFMPEGDDEDEL